jgi:hypothetical protein
MKYLFSAFLLFNCFCLFSQEKPKERQSLIRQIPDSISNSKAKIQQYKIINHNRDTTYVDTTLTIQKEYKYNYLRKDLFGLLAPSNEGYYYNIAYFGLTNLNALPEIGFKAKHTNYNEIEDIKYYSVPTPITELFFKTTMEQGQNVSVLVTLNTSERFNLAVSYRGIRSLGKYINQLVSTGNFTLSSSFFTKNKRYGMRMHFTGQDISNGENGGITTTSDFESDNPDFSNRARLQVYLTDAKSFLKGKRLFLDHNFRINPSDKSNNLILSHEGFLENKFYNFNQQTLLSSATVESQPFFRFGESYLLTDSSGKANLNDDVRFNQVYNKVGINYENKSLGKVQFFIDDFRSNYYYKNVVLINDQVIPNNLSYVINSIGGQYEYRKKKWNGLFLASNSISTTALRNLEASINYKFDDKNSIEFQLTNKSKVPNNNYVFNQSTYVNYNWRNSFNNEKISTFATNAKTKWANATFHYVNLNDHLYFSDDATDDLHQLVSPKQYSNPINYIAIQLQKEFKYNKFALDNTFLYQKVDQKDPILNVPDFTARVTLYYSNRFFKGNLQIQTGVTVNYFTNYFANELNPIVSEFFVQSKREIGNFPTMDFFINGRIRQTRIFIKAEHFNSSFTGNNYYFTPNQPMRDFIVRFGLVWNLFN